MTTLMKIWFEEAAARCTKKIKRNVLKKHARKARTEHLVTCCLEFWKKIDEKETADRTAREDREEWQQELRRHWSEVYTVKEETNEILEDRIEHFKKKGDRHFTVEGRTAKITVDLVLQARTKMSDNRVKWPDDAIESEMINQLLLEKYTITKCFQERFMGQVESTRVPGRSQNWSSCENRTVPRRRRSEAAGRLR